MSTSTPATVVPIPPSTNSFYITALSLCPTPSRVSINWTQGSATFGATFKGPSSDYILYEKVFGLPIIVQEGGEMPKELSIEFEFGVGEDEGSEGDSGKVIEGQFVEEPVLTSCGPAGSSKKLIVKGYAAGDTGRKTPTTVTVMFKGAMRGLRRG